MRGPPCRTASGRHGGPDYTSRSSAAPALTPEIDQWSTPMTQVGMLAMALVAVTGVDDRKAQAVRIASEVLDDQRPMPAREAIIKDHPELSVEMIAAMTDDLTPGTKEEYRRIPWIWRVAIAAGKRNEAGEVLGIMERALP